MQPPFFFGLSSSSALTRVEGIVRDQGKLDHDEQGDRDRDDHAVTLTFTP